MFSAKKKKKKEKKKDMGNETVFFLKERKLFCAKAGCFSTGKRIKTRLLYIQKAI